MRVLLDECLPRGLKKHLRNHEVKTVPEAGWAPFGVVVLAARSNRLGDLLPLVSDILAALSSVGPGQVLRIGG